MTGTTTHRQLSGLLTAPLGVLGAATVLAQFARLGWLPELASHFRPQYLLALAMLLPVFLAIRRRKLALVTAALILPNAWYAVPYFLPLVAPVSAAGLAESSVSLISLNLWYRNDRYADVREYLERSAPDVMVLSELTPVWVAELGQVTSKYPYWVSLDRRTPWGLGVYSKYPLFESRSTDLGVPGSVNVVTTIVLPGGNVELVAAHLSSPSTPARAGLRNIQLGRLAEIVGSSSGRPSSAPPRLIIGDLNVTPFSPAFGDLLAATGMEDARRVHGLLGTWPTWMPLLQIQIDHCIADHALSISRVARGPALGSDHYPLEVTFRRRG